MDEKHYCKTCDDNKRISTQTVYFSDKMGLDLHRWEHHPNGSMEEHWSKLKKSNKLYDGGYSLGYQCDPYY